MTGPLAGIRVIEIGQAVAGPMAGMILGDMGAEVIKIEKPDGGDDARGWGPPFIDGDSMLFHSMNRNKKSVTLDIKNPDDVAKLKTLAFELCEQPQLAELRQPHARAQCERPRCRSTHA